MKMLLLLLSCVSRGSSIGGGIESERWMLCSQFFLLLYDKSPIWDMKRERGREEEERREQEWAHRGSSY